MTDVQARLAARPPLSIAVVAADRIGAFGRYTIISAAALAADFALYLNLVGHALPAAAASVVGYGVGLVIHYVLSSTFVFPVRAASRNHARTFAGFVATGLLGLAVTAAVVHALTASLAASPVIAKAIAVPAAFVAIYFVRRRVVFRWDAMSRSKSGEQRA